MFLGLTFIEHHQTHPWWRLVKIGSQLSWQHKIMEMFSQDNPRHKYFGTRVHTSIPTFNTDILDIIFLTLASKVRTVVYQANNTSANPDYHIIIINGRQYNYRKFNSFKIWHFHNTVYCIRDAEFNCTIELVWREHEHKTQDPGIWTQFSFLKRTAQYVEFQVLPRDTGFSDLEITVSDYDVNSSDLSDYEDSEPTAY